MAALSLSLPDLPHYWLRPLAAAAEVAAVLTPPERIWCAQLPPALRDRYSTSRRLLRHHLAALLGLRGELVPLHSPPAAPPRLAGGLGHVSLSHSGGQLLLAWSPAPIGVDLEWSLRPLQAAGLARRFFPPEEAERLLALPADDQRGDDEDGDDPPRPAAGAQAPERGGAGGGNKTWTGGATEGLP